MESDEHSELDTRLFNLIAWIVSPAQLWAKTVLYNFLSERQLRLVKLFRINSRLFLVHSQPGFNQILLSITTLAETRSQMVINDLKQVGVGISNTETMFI